MLRATKTFALSMLTAVALLVASRDAQANLVLNGDFSTNGGPGQLTVNTTLANWTGGGQEGNFGSQTTPPVFVFNSGGGQSPGATGDAFMGTVKFYGVTPSPNGLPFVGGDGDPAWKGSISQNITGLNVGDTYNLTFNWAGAQQQGFSGPTTERWAVSFGSSNGTTSTVSTPSQTFVGWQTASMNFTATSTSQVLSFFATGNPSGLPPWLLIDGVNMVDTTAGPSSTPEPSSVLMFGIGTICVIVAGRRRRSKAAKV